VSEILEASEGGEEVLIVEQTEELITDDSEKTVDDLMPRSSPDGSTDTDVDEEQHGCYNNALLTYLLTYLLISFTQS